MIIQKRVEKLNKVRSQDLIPGVLYGHGDGPMNIQVDRKVFLKTLVSKGQTAVFPCEIEGATFQVYIRDLQREVMHREKFQHFSLQSVNALDKISAKVAINIENKGLLESKGYILNHMLHEFDAKYGISEKLEDVIIDVSNLEVGATLSLGDLDLPSYLEVVTSLDAPVLSVVSPKKQQVLEGEDEGEIAAE